MAISQTIAIDNTGLSVPNAYGRIEEATVTHRGGVFQLTLSWYVSALAAASGFNPIRIDHPVVPPSALTTPNPTFVSGLQTACSNGTIASPSDALVSAMYLLVMQLPAYDTSVMV